MHILTCCSRLKRLSAALILPGIVLIASLPQLQAGDFLVESSRDLRMAKARVRAAQFLAKATFGPTEQSIESLATRINQIGLKRATSEWIDQQFAAPPSLHMQTAYDLMELDGNTPTKQGAGIHHYRYQVWSHIALTGEDQLRQRVAWALSQIFVIGDTGTGANGDDDRSIGNGERTIADWMGMSDYYDMLVTGIDGTYRETLEDVTYHPSMGVWLSSINNRKADIPNNRWPDENFAREIMQLFSVGLYELQQDGRLAVDENGDLIPTYDNEQIRQLARVFTGFMYQHNTSTSFYRGRNLGRPMEMDHRYHDNNYDYTDEANAPPQKVVFGTVLPPLPAILTNQACKDEVSAALDAIDAHDSVAPFICRLLIQRLVKSNPSRGYMRRVTRVWNDNGQGVRGDWQSVVKAILTDPELYRGQVVRRLRSPLRLQVRARGTEYSRLREPINRVCALIRAIRPSSNYPGGYMMFSNNIADDFGQMPFRSPSVFNYYLPDFQPPGELITYEPSRRNPYGALFAPEFQILTAVTVNKSLNEFRKYCNNRYVDTGGMRQGSCRISFDLEPEIQLARDINNMAEILTRFDLLLCSGTLSQETKASIIAAVEAETAGNDGRFVARVETALNAVVISPDCAIEQ